MSSPSDDDVKALLGRALADEPPLTLDRDEVFRQGRRKLRNRRRFESGGAIAGVVVAAVGAVLLTGLIAEEPTEDLPPAASRDPVHPAPHGPTLPLTPTEVTTQSSTVRPPAMSQDRADQLTVLLTKSIVLAVDTQVTTLGGGGKAGFEVTSGTYYLRADVRTPTSEGSLFVSVAAGDPAVEAGCEQIEQVTSNCEVKNVGGLAVAVGSWKDYDTGEKRYTVTTTRPDGTTVTAISTNQSERQRKESELPRGEIPIVDREGLIELVTLPDLRFHA